MINNKYKIIFIDIDGTLIDDEKNISEETISFITKLKDIGVYTVLAMRFYKKRKATRVNVCSFFVRLSIVTEVVL